MPTTTGIDRNLTHYADPALAATYAALLSLRLATTTVKRGVLHLPKPPMDVMVPM